MSAAPLVTSLRKVDSQAVGGRYEASLTHIKCCIKDSVYTKLLNYYIPTTTEYCCQSDSAQAIRKYIM